MRYTPTGVCSYGESMIPWSYSSLEKFENCPRQFHEVKVLKNYTEAPTVHTQWGKEVHSAFEFRIKNGEPLPEGMTHWEPLASKVAALPGLKHCEYPVALDKGYKPTRWESAWTRGVIDLAIVGDTTAAVLDWKTGKPKPSEQLDLYASYVFALFPKVQVIDTAFVWLKAKKLTKRKVLREHSAEIRMVFLQRAGRLEAAFELDRWPERPSGLCNGWCPVKNCVFYKEKQ